MSNPPIIEDLMQKAKDFSPVLCLGIERFAALSQAIGSLSVNGYFLPPKTFEPILKNAGQVLEIKATETEIIIKSSLPKNTYRYFYCNPLPVMDAACFLPSGSLSFTSVNTGDLSIAIALEWQDINKQKISSKLFPKKAVIHEVEIPPQAMYVRVGLRIEGSGFTSFKGIHFGERSYIDKLADGRRSPQDALNPVITSIPYIETGVAIPIGSTVKFEIAAHLADCQFALYIYRGDKRVFFKLYSEESKISYTFDEPGTYTVKGFVNWNGIIAESEAPPVLVAKTKENLFISDLRIATILDEFSTASFASSCKVFPVTVSGFREELEAAKPHFLLVESAWHGSNDSWLYKIGKYARNDWKELREIIDLCRGKGIPTVFWNKEDPVHFEKFIDAAKLFDWVYTTDSGLIERYRQHVGHDRVSSLMFAAQPREHNPIRETERRPGSFFAGSYYANRHEQRRADMDAIFDAAGSFPFTIYDRNHGTESEDYMFPERFRRFIKGKLAYSEIKRAYKGYQVALNVNSVVDSKTMFSRRVFECLACGTPVVSTPSEGVRENFPDIVPMANDVDGYKAILKRLTEDTECWSRLSHLGAREVLQNHTYAHRLRQICADLNYELIISGEPEVTVISTARGREDALAALNVFRKQTYRNKRLWLFVFRFDGWLDIVNTLQSEDVSVFFAEHVDNVGLESDDGSLIAYINPEKAWCGANYISDLVMAQQYSNADAVMKPEGDGELSFTDMPVRPWSSIIKRQVIGTNTVGGLLALFTGSDRLHIEGKVFCADRYNFSLGYTDCEDV